MEGKQGFQQRCVDLSITFLAQNSTLIFLSVKKVLSTDLGKFHAAYGALLKSSMSTLRKRDKMREKLRSAGCAAEEDDGTWSYQRPGKRQRQLKAALKQQESQHKFKDKEETRRKGITKAGASAS
jgi:hypothetical protein